MQFLYDKRAGSEILTIEDENFRYLVKVRRFKVKDQIKLINFEDDTLYLYQIASISKKTLDLQLLQKEPITKHKSKKLHILWCIVDPKTIYQTIPMLNQIGVSKITLLYCQRSQKNFKPDLKKIEKILINSSQQCGRYDLMEVELLPDLNETINRYGEFAYLDFGGDPNLKDIDTILIGCEGGFSENERQTLNSHPKMGLKIKNILKSETAVLTLAIKSLT